MVKGTHIHTEITVTGEGTRTSIFLKMYISSQMRQQSLWNGSDPVLACVTGLEGIGLPGYETGSIFEN